MRYKIKCKNHSGVLHLFTNLSGTKYGGEQDRTHSLPSGVWGLGSTLKESSTLTELGTQVLSAMVRYQHKRGHSAYKCVNKGRGTNVKLEYGNPLQCSHLLWSMSSVHSLGKYAWKILKFSFVISLPHNPTRTLLTFRSDTSYFILSFGRKRIFCKN